MLSEPIRQFVRWYVGSLLILVVGCASAQDYVDRYAHQPPSLAEFTVCHGYGCRLRKTVRIESFAWAEVASLFDPSPKDAADERVRVARAIALLEIKVGNAIGTTTDRAAAETFGGDPAQLDCIDETVNTTTYLRLLAKEGLMRWHRVGTAAQRGSISGFQYNDFITNTAVILEKDTGTPFAVDSYFYANGREPKIMPLADWKKNWRPVPNDPRLLPLL